MQTGFPLVRIVAMAGRIALVSCGAARATTLSADISYGSNAAAGAAVTLIGRQTDKPLPHPAASSGTSYP
jgi:hypothetical protein